MVEWWKIIYNVIVVNLSSLVDEISGKQQNIPQSKDYWEMKNNVDKIVKIAVTCLELLGWPSGNQRFN